MTDDFTSELSTGQASEPRALRLPCRSEDVLPEMVPEWGIPKDLPGCFPGSLLGAWCLGLSRAEWRRGDPAELGHVRPGAQGMRWVLFPGELRPGAHSGWELRAVLAGLRGGM